eukprot:TRINITY_DN8448_c0_g1_i4.p1 TRINITY_DN8448_c0_g1~~TRINITY_DN8448_c0_g1_i4.p1  ORF type:complete len:398 (+),score=72.47 TRINITY_DN8448_c0_g1_i4:64-1257(+)
MCIRDRRKTRPDRHASSASNHKLMSPVSKKFNLQLSKFKAAPNSNSKSGAASSTNNNNTRSATNTRKLEIDQSLLHKTTGGDGRSYVSVLTEGSTQAPTPKSNLLSKLLKEKPPKNYKETFHPVKSKESNESLILKSQNKESEVAVQSHKENHSVNNNNNHHNNNNNNSNHNSHTSKMGVTSLTTDNWQKLKSSAPTATTTTTAADYKILKSHDQNGYLATALSMEWSSKNKQSLVASPRVPLERGKSNKFNLSNNFLNHRQSYDYSVINSNKHKKKNSELLTNFSSTQTRSKKQINNHHPPSANSKSNNVSLHTKVVINPQLCSYDLGVAKASISEIERAVRSTTPTHKENFLEMTKSVSPKMKLNRNSNDAKVPDRDDALRGSKGHLTAKLRLYK